MDLSMIASAVSNWNNISNIGQVASYAGIRALSGLVFIMEGFLGGAIKGYFDAKAQGVSPLSGNENPKDTRFIVGNDGKASDMKPTVDRINSRGTYPHRNDGSIFQNRIPKGASDPLLPKAALGTYKEYVVPPPGMKGAGIYRIVTDGKNMWFTPDHYKTFIKFKN